ncbi:hypothetical protein GPJ56_006241 [Histomonas meleagridis]|uniref:uncharacterized protein n=1 Tax=Histomonas meleagridis TaxID=135588 RepID=UPI003559C3FE|nr:hypothetical protein GPJ56_006241 [Histomonas meleagridis]KAH0796943.1 hypothetical protein GO595_010836 [Histomonas meleagridis]
MKPSTTLSQTQSRKLSPTLTQLHLHTVSLTLTFSHTLTLSHTKVASSTWIPDPTSAFTSSNASTNSNTFTNSFTEASSLNSTLSPTFSLVHLLSFTQTVVVICSYLSLSQMASFIDLSHTIAYVSTVFYEYSILHYSTYFSYYSLVNVFFAQNDLKSNSLGKDALVGLVCGCVAAVLIIAGAVVFLFRHKRKEDEKIAGNSMESKSEIDEDVVHKANVATCLQQETDQWI